MKKYSFFYEIPLFYAFLYGINRVFLPEFPAYIGLDPHPYWAGILLFGLRYGIPAGLATGILSAGMYLAGAWLDVERYLLEDLNFYFLPFFFVLGGALTGIGVNRYRARIDALNADLAKRDRQVLEFKEDIASLKAINQGLEKRIVTRMATLATLYEGAKRLETADLDGVYAAVLEFVSKTLEAEEAAIYLKTPTGWERALTHGWPEYHQRPQTIQAHEGLIGMAGSKGKIITVRDFIGNDSPAEAPQVLGDALAAGPLKAGEKGETVAVFSIQRMPFLKFNSSTVSLLSFLLDWASRAVGRAYYLKELKSQEIIDPQYQVYSHRYFTARAAQEFSRSKTYYLPLGLGLLELPELARMKPAIRERWMAAACQVLKESVRDMDVVARYEGSGAQLAVLWITASPVQMDRMRDRIIQNLRRLDGAPRFALGVAAFNPKMDGPEDLIREAENNRSSQHAA